MFKNYLTVAIRNIARHKMYSFINIAGLAIGMACCGLILLYIQHELGYDTFHSKGNRIYRVVQETRDDQGNARFDMHVPSSFAIALKQNFPEVEETVRLSFYLPGAWSNYGDHAFSVNGFFDVDPDFLNMFDFDMIEGNRETALNDPFSAVISEKVAQQYFGSENPIGKTISIKHNRLPGDYNLTLSDYNF